MHRCSVYLMAPIIGRGKEQMGKGMGQTRRSSSSSSGGID
jgi:hypothetical protein